MNSRRLCVVAFRKVLISWKLAIRNASDTTHNVRKISATKAGLYPSPIKAQFPD